MLEKTKILYLITEIIAYRVVFMAEEKKQVEEKAPGKKVGKVTHYYTNIGVAVIELTGTLKVGDKIRIKGATSDFEQTIDSMQIEHDKIEEAKKGQSIGLKVKEHVRQHDVVYKI
jgi:putative protease